MTHDPTPPAAVTEEAWDARPGSFLRALIAAPLWFGWAFLGIFCMVPMALFTRAWFRRNLHHVCHVWGRTMLWVAGVRLDVVGTERLTAPGPVLLFFNHQSLMDLALLTSVWPANGSVLYKREFHSIPLMGWVMRGAGMIPIDRGDRRAAIESLEEAAALMRERGTRLLVSPEGTRSRRGGLLPFKRGPFHLALTTRAPIVPLVYRGVRQLMPQGRLLCRPGVVRVEVLEPIDTSDWRFETLDAHIAEVRGRFLSLLPEAPRD